jgi:3-(3-hydroxy-phenyl)propionate hydroxylase
MNPSEASTVADVLIVGMGPVGLTLANLLGQEGVRTVVLEQDLVPHGQPRAVGVDDESMRVFQTLGVDEEMAQDMVMDVVVQFVLPDGRLLARIASKNRTFWKSPMCFHYQPLLEAILRRNLARFDCVDVRYGHMVTGIEQDGDGVTVHYRIAQPDAGGAEPRFDPVIRSLRSRYIVGCDGGRSAVRELSGIAMTGRKYPDPWLVLDVKLESTPRHLPYFNYYCDPVRPHLNCPQPNGHHRFEFMLLPGETPEQMDKPEVIRELLAKFVDPDRVQIVRHLVYTFNALIADRWMDRRVLLAGDAAHMTPQFFGQGMNSGIRDVGNLAWKLILVLKGHAAPQLLESYERERLAHYKGMMAISVAIGKVVSVRNRALVMLRNAVATLLRRTPWLGRFIEEMRFKPPPQFPRGSYVGLPRAFRGTEGLMFIQPTVRTLDGKYARLDDLMGSGFAVIGYGTDPKASLSDDERKFWDSLNARYFCAYPPARRPGGGNVARCEAPDLIEIEDMSYSLDNWFRRYGGFFAARRGVTAIVRPDRYVFALTPARNLGSTTARAVAAMQSGATA